MLVVAGEPWDDLGPVLAQQVRARGIEKLVQLRLGWVPEAEVPLLLAAADLVVLPYRSGSQSAVAPLALAAGRPVILATASSRPMTPNSRTNRRITRGKAP